MTIYAVTTSNWNSPSFWSGIIQGTSGHTIDFSGLGSGYTIDFDANASVLTITNGATTFTVGDVTSAGGTNATLGGSTDWSFFTTIFGSQGNDAIDGGSVADQLYGGDGNDTLLGLGGADTLYGGNGADSISGGAGTDSLFGDSGDDTLLGGSGNDFLFGGSGQNHHYGGTGNDSMVGGSTLDRFYFTDTFGNDTVDGVLNTSMANVLDFSALSTGINVVTTGNYSGTVTSGTNSVTFTNIDAIELTAFNDYVDLRGFDASVTNLIISEFTGLSDGVDTIIGGDGADQILMNDGGTGDLIMTGANDDFVLASGGNDTIYGEGGNDFIGGSFGNDFIDGGTGDDELFGDGGNDTLIGGGGADWLVGDAGRDSLDGGDGNDVLEGGDEDDTLRGLDGADTIYGGNGIDFISGGAGADSLFGDSGNDYFFIADNFGADVIVGGETGETTGDALSFTAVTSTGISIVYSGNEAGTATNGLDTLTFTQIEVLTLTDQNDTVNASASTVGVSIDAGNGNDLITGGSGNDSIQWSDGADTVYGGLGNDEIYGGGFGSVLYGGDGNDYIQVGWDGVTAYGDAGADTIYGVTGNETTFGGSGNDVLYLYRGDDLTYGGAGNDTIWAEEGADTIYGGTGNDLLYGGADGDTFRVENSFGVDTVSGGETVSTRTDFDVVDLRSVTSGVTIDWTAAETGTITSGVNSISFSGIEQIILTNRNDVLDASSETVAVNVDGADGDDILTGGSGNDIFYGGAGSDTLYSSVGNDTLYGGNGWDYVFVNGTLGNHHIELGVETPDEANTNDWVNLNFAETLDLTYTGSGGSVTNGTDTLTFDQVDGWSGTFNYGGTFDASALTGYGVGVYITGGWATLYGSNQDDAFWLDGADDRWVDAGDGNDFVVWSGGNDTYFGGAGDDYLDGDAGNDILYGGADNDLLEGGFGSDTLIGGLGTDTLRGEDGDDDIILGSGDSVVGGAGDDEFYVYDAEGTGGTATIVGGETGEDLADGTNGGLGDWLRLERDSDVTRVTTAYVVTATGAEAGTVTGGDTNLTWSQIENIMTGDGNDTIDLSLDTSGMLVYAEGGADSVTGGSGDDVIYGGLGGDTIHGGDGNDYVDGGEGNDLLTTGLGNDTLIGGEGNDTLMNSNGDDSLVGGSGDDLIIATGGNDTLEGGDGNDTLLGGIDHDQMFGGSGDDTFRLEDNFGNDVIVGGETGETNGDTLDLSLVTTATTIDLTATDPEAGTVSDGTSTAVFSEIENIVLGGGRDTIVLANGSGNDTVAAFDMTDSGDGTTNDQLDVSGLTDANGAIVNTDDVSVSDDGSGNAVLTFPGGETITLIGVSPAQLSTPAQLASIGIPMPDYVVSGTAGADLIDGAYTGDPQGDMVDASDASDGSNDDVIDAGAGVDTVYGQAGNDSIMAGDGDDFVYGGDGADTLLGDAGNDFVFGDAGSDSIFGGGGDDALSGGDDADFIDGGQGSDLLIGDAGDDTLRGDADNDTLYAGTGDDQLQGGTGDDWLHGEDGADTLTGDAGNDTLFGNAGDDTFVLESGFGNDIITGGETGETDGDIIDLSGHSGPVTVTYTGSETGSVSAGTDTATFSEIERLTLTGGNDSVDGSADGNGLEVEAGAGNDTVRGGSGADTVYGGADADVIYGGAGDVVIGGETGTDNDTLVLNYADVETITYGGGNNEAGTVTFTAASGGGTLTFSEIESIQFVGAVDGTAGDDEMNVGFTDAQGDQIDGSDGLDDTIFGGGGKDDIYAGQGNDLVYAGADDDLVYGSDGDDTIYGEGGNDALVGDAGNDLVFGGDGNDSIQTWADNDTVFGGDGNDWIDGGAGSDSIDGGLGNDELFGQEDNDTISGGGGFDTIYGGAGNDSIVGGSESDTLVGDDGDDTIEGGDGNDLIQGNLGNDSINAGAGDDDINAGDGADTVFAGDGNDIVFGFGGNDQIDAGAGSDTVYAGADDDTIIGGTGDDWLSGEEGNDLLDGGSGNDTLTGGLGNDTFVFAADGIDTITDFNFGNTGTLNDRDNTNNDFVDLSAYYDRISEVWADQADDGILNQSNQGVNGVDYSNNSSMAGGGLVFTGASADKSSFTVENTGVVCFTEGTLIITPKGAIPIENLRVGDPVLTRDNGVQRLVWIGRRALDQHDLARDPALKPILLDPSLTGGNAPLLVSPQHGVLLRQDGEEVLFRAKHLAGISGGKARVCFGRKSVVYYHIAFESHQIVFANGAPSESFYPGPTALAALSPEARAEIEKLFPGLLQSQTLDAASRIFGEPARAYSRAKYLPENLRALAAAG